MIATSSVTPPTASIQERTFRPDIEGLRAIAVMLVLLDHAGLAMLSGGFVGVDVFFVLSGFLITGLLLREIEKTGGVSLMQFYARRARRLLPASALVLAVTVIASYEFIGGTRADRIAEDARWSALFASNFRFIQQGTDYLDAQLPPSPLQHFWSLAVEEQFYAVWPAIILLVAVTGRRFALRTRLAVVLSGIIAASLIWSIHQTTVDGTTAYFSPFTRASELAAGALLAVVLTHLHRIPNRFGSILSWGGIGVILASGFLFNPSTPFPGFMAMIPVIGTMLVIAGGTVAPGGGAEFALKQAPFQWVGKISYSLYLWHWAMLIIAAGWAGHELSLQQNLAICALAIPVAAATYLFVENPIRGSTLLKSHPPLASIAVGAAIVVLSFGFSGWMLQSNSAQQHVDSSVASTMEIPSAEGVVSAVAEGVNVTHWPAQPPRIKNQAYSKSCDVTRKDTTSSVCIHGDPNGTKKVVVYGDSHAAMWIPALDLLGKQEHWQVIQLTKPGCPVPDFAIYSGTLKREYTECAEYRAFALDQIEHIKPDMVILSSAFKDVKQWSNGEATADGVEEAWMNGLGSMIDRISGMTSEVIVLGDMAYPAEPGIDCLTANAEDVAACNTPRDEAVLAEHNALEQQTAVAHGARYIDVIPWFCTDTVCPAVVGGLTTHRDAYHTAENYVVWLSRALGNATGILPDGEGVAPIASS